MEESPTKARRSGGAGRRGASKTLNPTRTAASNKGVAASPLTQIQIERKNFVFILKENPRGRFLRIIEDVGGRRNTIIIPAPGLEGFRKVLEEMVKAAAGDPTVHQP